jgi:hypothetical protein
LLVMRPIADRSLVVELSARGWAFADIVRETGFSLHFVHRWSKRESNEPLYGNIKRARKATPFVKRTVRRLTQVHLLLCVHFNSLLLTSSRNNDRQNVLPHFWPSDMESELEPPRWKES